MMAWLMDKLFLYNLGTRLRNYTPHIMSKMVNCTVTSALGLNFPLYSFVILFWPKIQAWNQLGRKTYVI
jgi:hypothetical protein